MLPKSSLALASIFLVFTYFTAIVPGFTKSDAEISLEEGFVNPPLSAKPRAYWAWINGNVSLSQLTRDLEEIKEKGLSGFDIFDVGARDRQNIVPLGVEFLGEESMEAIGHAIREASRLGLELGLITSSSWNAGGPWVKAKHGTMGLFFSQISLEGSTQFSEVLPFPDVPENTPIGENDLPVYYKNIAVLAIPQSDTETIQNVESIIDLTNKLEPDGRLNWDAPAGDWLIQRYVCVPTGERLVLPSPKSDGLIIDHFNPEATEMHFQYIIDKLQGEIGDIRNSSLKILYLPSYEVTSYEKDAGLIWTPNFIEEFQQRRGYDLTPYLPVLFGSIVQNREITERFQFDFKMTLSDMIIENHYQKAREISNRYGMQLCCEAGGPGQPLHNCPFEALRALGVLDIPRGEFWNDHVRLDEDGNDIMWLVKEIACASHIYGKTIVDGEAFTSWYHWQEGPFDLKPLADRAMCGGLNRFTLHTGAHSPPEAGLPGWVYHAGTHVNVNRVWWPKAKPFLDYLGRCCYLLQQGLFVGDVCYYYGDKAPNFVKPKHIDPSLGYGYDYDVTNSEVILTRMDVKNGRIILPDGMNYELLVLPDQEDMNLHVLQKLERLVNSGATLVGPKPTRTNGLTNYPHNDEKVRDLADKLWGTCDGKTVKENQYGDGKIIWGRSLREILLEREIDPDFQFKGYDGQTDLDYIHRQTQKEDIYFIWNKNMRWEEVDCTFRVHNKVPELWMPDTGKIQPQMTYKKVKEGIQVPLRIPPAGSCFVVFRKEINRTHFVSINRNSESIFPLSSRKPQTVPFVEVKTVVDNKPDIILWQDGNYVFKSVKGEEMKIQENTIPSPLSIQGPWEIRFPFGWGAPSTKIFPELISWTMDDDEGIQFFSGIASYHKEFEIPNDLIGPDKQLTIDLGTVKQVADVFLNGKHIGILWKPPFRLDITHEANAGANRLVVEVANTWSNRITGDAKLSSNHKYTQTNITSHKSWSPPWKEAPLIKSGLLGPVRIYHAKKIELSKK